MMTGDGNAPAKADEGEEIDRIMKEIEDLEKKMDSAPAEAEAAASAPAPKATAPAKSAADVAPEEDDQAPAGEEEDVEDNVVPMRPASPHTESLAETDAVPPRDEPLVRAESDESNTLALKVGGCTEVNLEFARAGVTITLECTDDGLKISTNQGAEFRLPFKRTA